MDDVSVFILSGGLARRAAGRNKSFIVVDGKTIIEHQLERLLPQFNGRITLITDREADYAGLPVAVAPDPSHIAAERSSLRGLASALALCKTDWAFMLAGDMPWPDTEILRIQWEHAQRRDLNAVLLEGDRGIEPFHGLYRSSLAASALAAVGNGELQLRTWIAKIPKALVLNSAALGEAGEGIAKCLENFNAPPEGIA